MTHNDFQYVEDIANGDYALFIKLMNFIEQAKSFDHFKFRLDKYDDLIRRSKETLKISNPEAKLNIGDFETFEELEKAFYEYQGLINISPKKKDIINNILERIVKNDPNLKDNLRRWINNSNSTVDVKYLMNIVTMLQKINRADFKQYIGDLGKYKNFYQIEGRVQEMPYDKIKQKIAGRLRVGYREEFLDQYFSEIRNRFLERRWDVTYSLFMKKTEDCYVDLTFKQLLQGYDQHIKPALRQQARYDSIDDIFFSIIDYQSEVNFNDIKNDVKKTRGAWVYFENNQYLVVRLRSFGASKKLSPKGWCVKHSFYWFTDSGFKFYLIFDKLARRTSDRILGYSVWFGKESFISLNQLNDTTRYEARQIMHKNNIKVPSVHLLEIPWLFIRRLGSIFLYFGKCAVLSIAN